MVLLGNMLNKRNGGAFGSEDECLFGGVGLKGNRTVAGSEAATLPNTRMQRTRSSPSALRSPLMRCPLGSVRGPDDSLRQS